MTASERTATDPPATPLPATAGDRLGETVAANIRRLRLQQGLSVERLAALSGVARVILLSIEQAGAIPTIDAVWKVAKVLGVPFSSILSESQGAGTTVLRRAETKPLTSPDGRFTSRALFPLHGERLVEFYELRLAPGAEEAAEAHAPGTTENIVVVRGGVEIVTADGPHALEEGDAILFDADAPHIYRNPGDTDAVLHLVMAYVDPVIA